MASASNQEAIDQLNKRKKKINDTTKFHRIKEEELDINYSQDALCGIGGFGRVLRGKFKTRGNIPVAVKHIFDLEKVPNGGLPRDSELVLLKEAKAMYHISHNSVVTIFGIYMDPPKKIYAIVMEYMKYSSLHTFARLVTIPASIKVEMMMDVADGFCCLHHHEIIHADVKLENILINSKFQAKIGDFGLAKLQDITSTTDLGPAGNDESVRCTYAYMAPERFDPKAFNLPSRSRTKEADVWSFGVALYCFLTGQMPFEANEYAAWSHQVVHTDVSLDKPDRYDAPVLAEITLQCLQKVPTDRPKFEEIAQKLHEKYDELYMKQSAGAYIQLLQSVQQISRESGDNDTTDLDLDVVDYTIDYRSSRRVHQVNTDEASARLVTSATVAGTSGDIPPRHPSETEHEDIPHVSRPIDDGDQQDLARRMQLLNLQKQMQVLQGQALQAEAVKLRYQISNVNAPTSTTSAHPQCTPLQEKLKSNLIYFKDNLMPENVYDYFIQAAYMTPDDVERIKHLGITTAGQASEFLKFILKKDERAILILCHALNKEGQGFLADKLKESL